MMVLSLGVIISATLTPQWEALAFGTQGSSSCDLSRLGLAPLEELLALNETSLNVLLFVPLGASIAFIPLARTKVVVAVAAIALPFAIEATQLLVPLLDRGRQSGDVIDNLTGLAVGFRRRRRGRLACARRASSASLTLATSGRAYAAYEPQARLWQGHDPLRRSEDLRICSRLQMNAGI